MKTVAMLRSRISRNALLAISVSAFTVFGAQTASADEDRRVFMRFAGDFVRHIEQTDTDFKGLPGDTTSLLGLVRAKVRGNLGRADLAAAAKAVNLAPVWDKRCPDDGFFLKVTDITDNSLVLTFSDLSLLYGNGQGVVCLNFEEGERYLEQYIAVDGEWLGGTGRFRNAKGEFSISFNDFVPVNPNTQIVAETGRITGTLSRDR